MTAVSERLGYRFNNPALLHQALTHRSWCAENDGAQSNERLEFLGDAVLGLAVTGAIFSRFPDLAEGSLAKVRAAVVSAPTLAETARALGLGDDLMLGKGEAGSGGREKQSILADGLEAVIGAVYVDGGWAVASELVLELFDADINDGVESPGLEDYKTRLQELVAKRYGTAPVYTQRSEGPDHSRVFFATVKISGEPMGDGSGSSKKAAEQRAAEAAWQIVHEDEAEAQVDRKPTPIPKTERSEIEHG